MKFEAAADLFANKFSHSEEEQGGLAAMHRQLSVCAIGFLVLGLLTASPASAGDEAALQEKVNKLTEQVAALSAQQNALLSQEVAQYLETNQAWRGAEGGEKTAWDKVTLKSSMTIVTQATVGLDPANRTIVSGDLDLDFGFNLNENLDLFVNLTANTGGEFDTSGGGFSGIGAFTAAAFNDGIGVNGTAPTDPGSITVREAGIRHRWQAGDSWVYWEMGELEPRDRFGDTGFTMNENTQFLNNQFDDASSVPYLTGSVVGIHLWVDFGADKNVRFSAGWFNGAGQFFNNGQFFIQVGWKGEVSGRTMNLKVFGYLDKTLPTGSGSDDTDAGGGVVWDWMATNKIGLFVKIAANGSDFNPVELDASVGAVVNGLVGSRPDDQLGVAVGFIGLNDDFALFPEDTELVLEVFYRAALEGGKLHATFGFQIITDQGGGIGWADDTLFLLHVRIHVPF